MTIPNLGLQSENKYVWITTENEYGLTSIHYLGLQSENEYNIIRDE
jgi:hypothetical protein